MKEILIVPHLHFDPVWRRCFDRPAKRHGITVRSYAEIEERCINDWLRLAKSGYTFSEGQAAVWRKYLERNPERRATLQKEARAGRLDLVLAGEVVPDSNLSTAEGLIRNFLVAQPIYRDLAGDNPGLKLAWLEDAFGNSANYPQVLAGVGAEVVFATTYRVCPDPVWIGIDGTRLLCADHYPAVRPCCFGKYAPCAVCRGKGCSDCGGSGLGPLTGFDSQQLNDSMENALQLPGKWAAVFILAEEKTPESLLVDLVEAFNRRYRGQARAVFANPSDIFRRYLPALRRAAARVTTKHLNPELNPAMPGCMVTRIRCKQRTRAIAYQLIAAEAKLANESWKRRIPKLPPPALATAWRKVCFNQFHDAITGTHIDAAYTELMAMLDLAERTASRLLALPKRRKFLPRLQFFPVQSFPARVSLGKFEVTFDQSGLCSVLREKKDVFGSLLGFHADRRPYRIAELVLEADFGDAWGQRIPPFPDLRNDPSRVALGDFHSNVEYCHDAIRWRGSYRGGDPKVRRLNWIVTMTLSADGERLDFVTDVDWDTESRRLRVLVPVNSAGSSATYEIPFGFVERKFDPEVLNYSQLRANTMEFPTLHWVRKEIDRRAGVAVINKGLPCARWMPGCLDLSLLRSPEASFCVVEPAYYEFWDIDGQKDAGRHRFEYSIWPYYDSLAPHELTVAGYEYNQPQKWELPFRITGNVVVTAWKQAEDGTGWVVRLQESSGRSSAAVMTFNSPVSIQETDLLERPKAEAILERTHRLSLRPHEIRTLKLQITK